MVDFVNRWSTKTGLAQERLSTWLGIGKKLYAWKQRYGKVNEHNARIPRDHWIEQWERDAIIAFHGKNPLNGYRRLTFMMLDQDVVAVSPATTHRVLRAAGLLDRWNKSSTMKGTGFEQPLRPHAHWHIDIAYLNILGTFFYFCCILDGYSRKIVHWEIRESMKETDVETIIQRGREKYPEQKPRIISDNGPQFIARDFKEFIRIAGMTHVRTSPYYPQSNGKIERFNGTFKTALRANPPTSFDEAIRTTRVLVDNYNDVRLHSAIGYVTPSDKLAGREKETLDARDRKLETARAQRAKRRQAQRIQAA